MHPGFLAKPCGELDVAIAEARLRDGEDGLEGHGRSPLELSDAICPQPRQSALRCVNPDLDLDQGQGGAFAA